MKPRWILSILYFSIVGVYSGCSVNKKLSSTKNDLPNILIILADDLGYGDIQAYNPESKIPTPNLDRLSREGLQFTDAHSGSAVCTPTRYGLLTGRYAFRSPLKKGVLGGYSPPLIEENRLTLAGLLENAGYYTAVIGKWHLGLSWPVTDASQVDQPESPNIWPSEKGLDLTRDLISGPNQLGFSFSHIISSSLDIPPYIYLENGRPLNRNLHPLTGNNHPRGVFWREGTASEDFRIDETLDHFGNESKRFLVSASRQHQPFFLYLPLTSPHTPWLPAHRFQGKSGAGTYGDFVMHTDDVVGSVLRSLDSLGMKDNTIVIFTSDNGADWKPGDKQAFPLHKANGILRGQKSDVWEGGHRVPFLVRWPGRVKSHRKVSQTICLTDLMATVAALTNQSLPPNSAQDSFDFSPLLRNSKKHSKTRETTIHHSINGMFAIRQGPWKYIEGAGSGGWSKDSLPGDKLPAQLYNLDDDPGEIRNLVADKPELAESLKRLLEQQKRAGYTRKGAME